MSNSTLPRVRLTPDFGNWGGLDGAWNEEDPDQKLPSYLFDLTADACLNKANLGKGFSNN